MSTVILLSPVVQPPAAKVEWPVRGRSQERPSPTCR